MYNRWHEAFDAYEIALNYCRFVGLSLYNKEKDEAYKNHDFKFRALSVLHANACIAAHSILLLLQHGFAQEALNKWRSMFEMSCFALLIQRGDQDLAERFVLHAHIEDAKMMELEEAELKASGQPYDEELFHSVYAQRDVLLAKYGNSYNGPYGWAVAVTKNKSPKITDIVAVAGFNQYLSQHKTASISLHGSFNTTYNISTPPSVPTRLWGPSSHGVAHAGELALLMLMLCTVNFQNLRQSRETYIAMEVMGSLVRRAQNLFASIEEQTTREDNQNDNNGRGSLPLNREES